MDFVHLDYHSKYPILLPKKHVTTDLIIMNAHRLGFHYGMECTVTQVRHFFGFLKYVKESEMYSEDVYCANVYKANHFNLCLPHYRISEAN